MSQKWYYCENKNGVSLQIAAYKYVKIPHGKSLVDESLASKFPTLLTEIKEEKKVLIVEDPVYIESEIVEDAPVVEVVEKEEVKPKKKRGRPAKKK